MFLFRATYLPSQGRSMENIASERADFSLRRMWLRERERNREDTKANGSLRVMSSETHLQAARRKTFADIKWYSFFWDTERLIVRRGDTLFRHRFRENQSGEHQFIASLQISVPFWHRVSRSHFDRLYFALYTGILIITIVPRYKQ